MRQQNAVFRIQRYGTGSQVRHILVDCQSSGRVQRDVTTGCRHPKDRGRNSANRQRANIADVHSAGTTICYKVADSGIK